MNSWRFKVRVRLRVMVGARFRIRDRVSVAQIYRMHSTFYRIGLFHRMRLTLCVSHKCRGTVSSFLL